MVVEITDIAQALKPSVVGGTSAVHNTVGSSLHGLVTAFGGILLLLMGLTLPSRDEKDAENILDFVTDLDLSTVTEELGHSSPITDVILEGVDKLAIGLDTIDVSDMGTGPNKQDSSSGAIINSRDIGIDNITSNRFIAPGDIKKLV